MWPAHWSAALGEPEGDDVSKKGPIPAILLDPSSMAAFEIFNPNEWSGGSNGLIQACASEPAGLHYSSGFVISACASAREACHPHFQTLAQQWAMSRWNLDDIVFFAQVPAVHVMIEAFFSGLKSLLDLSAQLLSTEGVVSSTLHGFHRANDIYGGAVLNALANNVGKERAAVAAAIQALVAAHKSEWIDEAIASRDWLLHPVRGAQQVMFRILLDAQEGDLVYVGVEPPRVGSVPIAEYVAGRLADVRRFSADLLHVLRAAA
jgi:hypothetical protein